MLHDLNLSALLREVCTALDLDPECHKKIDAAYTDISSFLSGDGFFTNVDNQIYPQGSVLLGTTNRPLIYNEYDIDCVNEAVIDPQRVSAVAYLDSMEHRLRKHPDYLNLTRKNRCIRVNLPGFHLDILPALRNPIKKDGSILVPDRKTRAWTDSNPKGYGKWLEDRCELKIKIFKSTADVIPLPDKVHVRRKAVLKIIIQLIKRNRDMVFLHDEYNAPISIVLTTLAATAYDGESSIEDAMTNILSRLAREISRSNGILVVRNPTNQAEILSEKWFERPGSYEKFKQWFHTFHLKWGLLEKAQGIHEVSKIAMELFGEEIVKKFILQSAENVGQARSSGALKVTGIGALSVAASTVKATPLNTFYGADY